MTYRTTHKMFSLKYPDKTWDNLDDFWTDHAEEDSEIDVILNDMESSGKLVMTESLDEDLPANISLRLRNAKIA